MNRSSARFTRTLAALAFAGAVALHAEDLREEFHQTYPLSPNGSISLKNVNGAVRVTGWDRNEVKVDAVKKARSQQALNDARIVVDARADAIAIRTEYPDDYHENNPASVDYTVMVPRQASLDKVGTVNGGVTVEGIAGGVRVSTVNGRVDAHGLGGDVELSTVNGRVEAAFDRLEANSVSMKTVNGQIALALPSNAGANLSAKTVHGDVESDFDLPIRRLNFGPGADIQTTIGGGGAQVRLSTVNGGIKLSRR
jgi:DUF4097 and DUF4098 domain-containing protein YvlB